VGKKNKKGRKKEKQRPEDSMNPEAVRSSKSLDLRSVEIPSRPKPMKPGEIRALRVSLNASQSLFARLLNVSSNAVESWEQGIRQPRQATLKLLQLVRKSPGALL